MQLVTFLMMALSMLPPWVIFCVFNDFFDASKVNGTPQIETRQLNFNANQLTGVNMHETLALNNSPIDIS